AALFLLAELVAAQRGDAGGTLKPASPVAQPLLLGLLLLLGGASVAGLPPLPGFLGKVMILQAAHGAAAPWVWAVVLGVGFFTLVGLARAGSILFWAVRPQAPDAAACSAGASPRLLAPMFMLVAATLAMVVWASPIKRYVDAAAQQVTDRAAYARAVLGDAQAQTVRPFRARPAGGVR
uniref:proton-conducting transporter transmembrane domain-containing protein n=1 Tax=uncultured Aquincola sp. TaxID=886556 RepID=UPI0032B2C854